MRSNITNDSIITGHSLGGFIAISMGFYFKNKRITSFNAPHVVTWLGNAIDLSKYILEDNFATNKIICYNSTKDAASILTLAHGPSLMIMIMNLIMNNIEYVNIPNADFHNMEPMLRELKKRNGHINWNIR